MSGWSNLLVLVFLLGSFFAQAQSNVKSLKEKQKALRQEIRATSSMLQKTKAEKKQVLNRVFALNIQIKNRQELIDALTLEIDSINHRINQKQEIVDILTEDLKSLQLEYAKILQNSLRYKYNKAPLLFLFSSDSFNQAFKRWLYLRQYNRYRSQQVEMVASTTRMLQEKVGRLSDEKDNLQLLLASFQAQTRLLEQEKSSKKILIQTLKKGTKNLRKKLLTRQKQQKQLNQQVSSMIALAEKRRKETLAKKRHQQTSNKSKPKPTFTPTVINHFSRAKGQLSWPANGYVTGFFGRHPHPTAPKVIMVNNGVDIRIKGDATIKAVFQGEVLGIEQFSGRGLTVLIKHGDYYSVYANLEQVFVNIGESVNTLQSIGIASSDTQGDAKLHFEIWKGKKAINPIRWLKK